MSGLRVASYGQENYPRAGQVRSAPKVSRVSTTAAVETGARSQNTSHDSLKNAYYDPHAAQVMELRRRAAAQGKTGGGGTKAPGTKGQTVGGSTKTTGNTGQTPGGDSKPPRTTNIDLTPDYPQAPPKSVPTVKTPNAPSHKGPSKAPDQDLVRYFQREQQRVNANSHSQTGVHQKDVVKTRTTADTSKPKAKVSAPPQKQPKTQPKPQKSTSGTRAKTAAGGVFTVASGAVSLKNGVKNLASGNYAEGGLQVTQGSLSVADGVNDLNIARKGLTNASAGTLTKGLKVGGSVVNAGMAAYDAKGAYEAFKSGNDVLGAEKASSAVINAVSAFPPTALVGAIGGVADWAMQASGADDAMVRALTSGKDKAYQKQIERDMKLAKILVKTPSTTLARCNQEQKQAYIRGLEGLKEYRKQYASQGKAQTVRDIDAQIARIKQAWTR